MTKKIKILRIINRFNLGGPTYNATFLTTFLSDKFETLLVGGSHETAEGSALFIPENYGVEVKLLNSLQREINFKQDRQAYKDIRKIIQDFKPDIVHTHASKAGAIGRLAASKEGVSVIIHTFHGHVFHSYFGAVKTTFYKMVERYLAKKSSAIIAISKLQKKELVEQHKIAKSEHVKVVNLGFDLDKFRLDLPKKRQEFELKYSVDPEAICIGIIGRLTAIKQHQLFFNAIQRVLETTKRSIHVFVIGDGELMDELRLKAESIFENSSSHNISFTSWIKDVSIPLARLDLVCLTSLNEGTPVSLIEAQAAGVPVVSTNVGGVSDIVKHNETGIIVNSFDVADYASALLTLIHKNELRLSMSQNGWEFVKEKFHYKTLCFNIENLYLELLNNKND